ncbi:MAG: peroxiredoxin [Pseudomonadota bacterium]
MTIAVGAKLPDATFYHIGEDGPTTTTTSDVAAGKKLVLFAVPGAFTPTCHKNHLPGFVEQAEALKEKGVDEIAVVSVNDVFVMDAWADISGAQGKITFLSDPNADFAKALGLELDLTERGLGMRSKRYAMIVDDGTVTTLNLEDNPGQAVDSSAEKLLESL